MVSSAMRLAAVALWMLALGLGPGRAALAQDGGTIRLQLFNTSELVAAGRLESAETCAFALHQEDRDPARETYHHAFFQPLPTAETGAAAASTAGAPDWPAIIQIDGEFLAVAPAAASQPATRGHAAPVPVHLAPRQLWMGEDGRLLVVLNLETTRPRPHEVIVDAGMMTVVRAGAAPFWLRVAGGTTCTPAPPPATGAAAR
jgi:hypothetical protein